MHSYSDTYNPVPGLMEGVPSSRDYNGGFASKLMVNNWDLTQLSIVLIYLDDMDRSL